MTKWRLETVSIEDLVPHDKNPRYISKEDARHLKRSIAKFGLIDKPIITNNLRIIGGHQRLQVIKEMGHKSVECWIYDGNDDLTQQDIDELNIRLNKNTGDWDWDKLANEWDVNLLCEWGFKPSEFEDPLPKAKKPSILFEFTDGESLDDAMKLVEEIVLYSGDKVKVKVKR